MEGWLVFENDGRGMDRDSADERDDDDEGDLEEDAGEGRTNVQSPTPTIGTGFGPKWPTATGRAEDDVAAV